MSVDILILTYNRKKFERLIETNINLQTYKKIRKVIICDDGNETLDLNIKYNIEYHKLKNRLTIAEKRNFLVKRVTSKYAAFMDDDDIYMPQYIYSSILRLNKEYFITGSPSMLIYNDKNIYIHRSSEPQLLNEATLVFEKQRIKSNSFRRIEGSPRGEGFVFLEGNVQNISINPIQNIMICISHSNNTVSKKYVLSKSLLIKDGETLISDEHKDILCSLLV